MNKTIIYQFENGIEHTIKDFEIGNPDKFFKVNLPNSYESYQTGNGEGVWACCAEEDYCKWLHNDDKDIIFVKILNDSYYYDGLYYGDIIPVELRAEFRPVAIYSELLNKYGESNF